jgi:F-type H+-transporting ATPase subunit epsilon
MWYRKGNDRKYAFVGGGFAEILPDRVAILAPVAERAEEIDIQRAEAAKRRAEDRLARPVADMDLERARVALLKALARLQVSRHTHTRG